MRHVALEVVDRAGGAPLFQEVRDAIHGTVDGWFDAVDASAAATAYGIRTTDDIVRLRARVEALDMAATR